uniref:Glutathione peroxidase n=1 Tax=Hirondellea gigas TaxID=1518452 RepID=A0A6A7FP16_9CRUS
MNQLLQEFQGRLAVLCFPTNQFGHQENTSNDEMLASLKHVRPGQGFEPLANIFQKIEVNGHQTHPLFKFLKRLLPAPADDAGVIMSDPKFIIWSPVCRSDIAWNFEKFLVDHNGLPYKRYSKNFETKDIAYDIKKLLKRQDRQQ